MDGVVPMNKAEIEALLTDPEFHELVDQRVNYYLRHKRKWRWKVLFTWITVFSIAVVFGYLQLRDFSVRSDQLEKTNCGFKTFIIAASNTRANDYNKFPNDNDRNAVIQYRAFGEIYTAVGKKCQLPKEVELKG